MGGSNMSNHTIYMSHACLQLARLAAKIDYLVANDASSNKPNLQKDAHHQQLQLLIGRVHLSRGCPHLVFLEGEISGTREGCGAPSERVGVRGGELSKTSEKGCFAVNTEVLTGPKGGTII